MTESKIIVINSISGYSSEHDVLLRKFIDEGVSLFCAVGKDCKEWEEAMDWLCVELSTSGDVPEASITTTSHPDESLAEVKEFANTWIANGKPNVEIIEI